MPLPSRSARRYAVAPVAPAPRTPTGPEGVVAEWRSIVQVGRLLAAAPHLAAQPRGDGSVVFDIPGWRAPEAFMAPIRHYLGRLGYDARPWGRGVNDGDVAESVDAFVGTVSAAAGQSGRPVSLIGWSYGGVVARETARRIPEHIARVITYGTPVIGGPMYTLGAREHEPHVLRRVADEVARLDAENPITVPITAFFSRRDHVVHWPATIDRTSADVEHISVGSTHLSLGFDPDVWAIIAQRLAGRGGYS